MGIKFGLYNPKGILRVLQDVRVAHSVGKVIVNQLIVSFYVWIRPKSKSLHIVPVTIFESI